MRPMIPTRLLKPRPISRMEKLRSAVAIDCPERGRILFEHLITYKANIKWHYLCCIAMNDTEKKEFKIGSLYNNGLNGIRNRAFHPEIHDETDEEAKQLREIGVGKMHYAFPWFALTNQKSLMYAKLVLGSRLGFIYDIDDKKILLNVSYY